MRANRGARGNAATNMVVKLNWITEERAKKKKYNLTKAVQYLSCVYCFCRQSIQQGTYPSPETHWTGWRSRRRWDGSCWASSEACSYRTVRLHVWPLIHLSGSSGHISSVASGSFFSSTICGASWCGTGDGKTQLEWRGLRRARAITNPICTYGPVNSKTLLMVCLSTIMIAIWMNRSVRHPLGWHCTGESGMNGCMNDM